MTEKEKQQMEFLGAAAAVYAWVSAADGEITKSEINSFIEYLTSLEYVDVVSDSDFEKLYLDLLTAFEINYDDGLNRAQARIEPFKGDTVKAEDLVRVARKSLLADQKLNEAEEMTLAEIAQLLGLSERNIQ